VEADVRELLKKHFDYEASEYDSRWYSSPIYNKFYLNTLLSFFPKIGNVKMLDVGGGSGFVGNFFEKKGVNVTVVDFSEEMLKIAKPRVSGVVLGDGMYLPFKKESFDYVITLNVFQHLLEPERVKFLSELRKVLKKGGILALETNCLGKKMEKIIGSRDRLPDPKNLKKHYTHYFDVDELKKLFAQAGIEIVKIKRIKHLFYRLNPRGGIEVKFTIWLEKMLSPLPFVSSPFVIVVGKV
jgi:ubiquinone/menaquinone biosynthesis C-methylase UbiE